jgi:hypothetical protein
MRSRPGLSGGRTPSTVDVRGLVPRHLSTDVHTIVMSDEEMGMSCNWVQNAWSGLFHD